MTVIKEPDGWTIECNGCLTAIEVENPTLSALRGALRGNGWTGKKISGKTQDFCPTCQKRQLEEAKAI